MLKKKRINNNTEELNEKIKEQMKKKFGYNNKFFKDNLLENTRRKCNIDSDIDAEIEDLASELETVSLAPKKKEYDYSLSKFELPSNKSTVIGNKVLNNDSILKRLKNEKQTPYINSIILKTREEKDQIEKENKVYFFNKRNY